MKATQFHTRYTINLETLKNGVVEDSQGNLFASEEFQWNADEMSILHSGVDTIKQLYSGLMDMDMLTDITRVFDSGFGQFIDLPDADGLLTPFMVTSGRKGGYRFILINNEIGITILVQNTKVKPELNGSHIKIELSPHYIINHSASDVQNIMDHYANQIIYQTKHAGTAVHLCTDFQGIEIPHDFDRQLTSRSRRVVSRTGLSEIDIPLLASRYGEAQSFLFGRASSLQFALYRKDIQAKECDKMHLWGQIWNDATDRHLEPSYAPDKPVWRAELRFHHSVIQELGRDKGLELNSYLDVSTMLSELWRYGLQNSYRWDMNTKYIHPSWQFLIESVFIPSNQGFVFTRRIKKTPGEGNQKNIGLAYGNLLSIYARNRFTLDYCMQCLKKSGLWQDLSRYWAHKTGLYDESHLIEHFIREDVERKLKIKRIGYGIAA